VKGPQKTCLFICPIGAEGSDIRKSSDQILTYVLRPVTEECGYSLVRADELSTPGLITQQIVDLLANADLVIADLTHHNPNVFYELAVRHATGKPVIQISSDQAPIPFDLKDFRTILFPLSDGTLGVQAAEKLRVALAQQIESVQAADGRFENPISSVFSKAATEGSQRETFEFFPAPRGSKYNSDFYMYFTEKIRNAKNAVYITGEGFECADEQGTALAQGFHSAFREALGNGVSVVRIQTKEFASKQWANMLSELDEEYPDLFELVTLVQHGTSQMSSVCVIDPDDSYGCVVEIMLQTEKLFGIRAADLAGTAVFIVGRQDLALDMRRRVVALCQSEQYHNYFAYGSNMAEQQMKQRCPSAEKVGVGTLRDHKLVFNRRGSYRPGGVASVTQKEGERVYGVVWRIASSDMSRLDETEDPDAYQRTVATVFGLDGSSWRAYLYEAIPEGVFEPDKDYLDLMLDAAAEAELPEEYVHEIKGGSTN
jgi:gamma-glutamylcyclotransferase (GGCT)/AIG2-like uncharacterized protein YtfP